MEHHACMISDQNIKTSVLVFIGMSSLFLAESCRVIERLRLYEIGRQKTVSDGGGDILLLCLPHALYTWLKRKDNNVFKNNCEKYSRSSLRMARDRQADGGMWCMNLLRAPAQEA
jgi:hypothetical protein